MIIAIAEGHLRCFGPFEVELEVIVPGKADAAVGPFQWGNSITTHLADLFTRVTEQRSVHYVPMEMCFDYDERIVPLDGPCAPKSELIKGLADELGLEVVDLSL